MILDPEPPAVVIIVIHYGYVPYSAEKEKPIFGLTTVNQKKKFLYVSNFQSPWQIVAWLKICFIPTK
jgi:hypothetical protein